jgi:tetratricopeptide (TPR) repeat protein
VKKRLSLGVATVLAAALILGLAVPTLAWAATPEDNSAIRLYERSAELYRAGRFAEAAELLRDAYRRAPDPVLLYNLGRACERMGDLPCVIDAYKRYLANASPPDRGAIEQVIITCEKQLEERAGGERQNGVRPAADDAHEPAREPTNGPSPGAASASPSVDRPQPTRAVPTVPAPVVAPPRALPRFVPWVVAGTGAATLGVALGLNIVAHDQHRAAAEEVTQQGAADAQSRAERTMTAASIALVAGGVLVLSGAIWGLLDAQSSPTAPKASSVGLTVGPGTFRVDVRF